MHQRGLEHTPVDDPLNLNYSKLHPENKVRLPVPLNDYGIVVPPPVIECVGEECKFSTIEPPCEDTRHHLHSSWPHYLRDSDLASEFRDELPLTIWIPRCRHEIHHNEHEIDVPIPRPEIMRECIEDARKLRELATIHQRLKGTEKRLASPDLSRAETSGLSREKYNLLNDRKGAVKEVAAIKIIPPELVTGALLTAAPNHARSRILMGSGYVLTGTIAKEDLIEAKIVGDEAIAAAEAIRLETEAARIAA